MRSNVTKIVNPRSYEMHNISAVYGIQDKVNVTSGNLNGALLILSAATKA